MELNKTNIKDFLLGRLSNGVYVNRLITNNFYGYLTKPELTDADFQTLISFMTTNGVLVKDKNGNYSTTTDVEPGPEPPTPPVPPEPTNRILYTVVEGGHKPESTWITRNCSDNVFDENTGKGYLVLNEGVTELDEEGGKPQPNIFNDDGGSSYIATIVIPTQITSIGKYAFHRCRLLTSITIPDSVTNIGRQAFYCCNSLSSITIPNSVISIGDGAFAGCSGLTSITIPNSVTSIGDDAFSGCTSVASVTCLATLPPTLGTDVFYDINTTTCAVPAASISAYQGNASWSAAFTTFVAA